LKRARRSASPASAPSGSPSAAGRNPQTGAPITIAASKVARFTAGKAVKDALNG
jgi:hypothetical protein